VSKTDIFAVTSFARPQPRASLAAIRVVSAEAAAAAAAVVFALLGLPWWAIILVALAAAVVAAGCAPFLTRRRTRDGRVEVPAIAASGAAGLAWQGSGVSAVLEVAAPAGALTTLSHRFAAATAPLPLDVVAHSLQQHGFSLSYLDIVAHGHRADASPAGAAYEELIAGLPAASSATVWLVLRLDALESKAAADARGGGRTGAARAVVAAARRLARDLASNGCRARLLTAPELTRVAAALQLETADAEAWALDPRRLPEGLLAELAAQPASGATLRLRLSPDPSDSGALAKFAAPPDSGTLGVSALFLLRGAAPPVLQTLARMPELTALSARPRDAVAACLPLGASAEGLAPTSRVSLESLRQLRLPPAGCGQLLGSDAAGAGVAARVVGPGIGAVQVVGEPYLACQLVFRAVATGARVLISSERRELWAPLVARVADPSHLALAGEGDADETAYTAVLFDAPGPETPPARAGATVIYFHDAPPRRIPPADVTIVQPQCSGDRIEVAAGQLTAEVFLITAAAEAAFTGFPQNAGLSG
jgi:type VII secretion protein EccE